MKKGLLKIAGGVAIACLCSNTMAAFLDFTDDSTIASLSLIAGGFGGSVDGVGFTLTSSDGAVNFDEAYDGSLSVGCQSSGGMLKCDRDGAGIGDDEISGISVVAGQKLTLSFDSAVYLSSLHFLDLYDDRDGGNGREEATITIDGAAYAVAAVGSNGDGGYADWTFEPILAQTIEFTAATGSLFEDDAQNDYAVAGAGVSVVPIPAAAWLFGSALMGLVGFGRRRKTA